MKILIAICPLFFAFAPPNSVIESEQMDFDGRCLRLKGEVCIENTFGRITADEAEWQKEKDLLTFKEGQKSCRFCHNEDYINAKKIDIDRFSQTLYFTEPQGEIMANQAVAFSCREMTWEEPNGLLWLKTDVVLDQHEMGRLTGAETVKVLRPKGKLQTIIADGETHLTTNSATLTCFGKITIDHEQLFTTLESPRGEGGVMPGKQNLYCDRVGDIHADKMQIKYQLVEKKITPSKIILKGNVHLYNRATLDAQNKAEVKRYILADKVEYFLDTQEMIFTAKNGKKVLFFDEINDRQLSAKKIKASRDAETGNESLQGFGQVRMILSEEEFKEIRKF